MELVNKKLERFLIENNALDEFLLCYKDAEPRGANNERLTIARACAWRDRLDYWKILDKNYESYIDSYAVVNSPSHYTSGKIECIEAIEESTKDLIGIEAVCTANVLKYIWRWKKKNGVEDLQKAQWYLNRLIEITNK